MLAVYARGILASTARPPPSQRLLTTRAALIVTLAVLSGLGGAGLLYRARFASALIVRHRVIPLTGYLAL